MGAVSVRAAPAEDRRNPSGPGWHAPRWRAAPPAGRSSPSRTPLPARLRAAWDRGRLPVTSPWYLVLLVLGVASTLAMVRGLAPFLG
ncbi:MAG: hypothetical protein DIU76_10550, partial [Bacillota bacterium]